MQVNVLQQDLAEDRRFNKSSDQAAAPQSLEQRAMRLVSRRACVLKPTRA